jgi:regulator of sirC expression with transglutaminase-like and TPR domain
MSSNVERINALVSLLGDEDVKIRRIARTRLLAFGTPAVNILNEVAFSDSEGRVRIEAKSLLEEIRLGSLTAAFERLQDQDNFDLETASLILGRTAYPDIDADEYSARLDRLAEDCRGLLRDVPMGIKRIALLNQHFFINEGFQGNRDAYYDPENSYINRVIDRKIGIPISLSVVYMLVARRLDLPVFGICFPGHFLLKYVGGRTCFFIDAFNGGLILTVQDCEKLSDRMGFTLKSEHLKTATPEKIFSRMLRNLGKIYKQQDDQYMLTNLKEIFYDFI